MTWSKEITKRLNPLMFIEELESIGLEASELKDMHAKFPNYQYKLTLKKEPNADGKTALDALISSHDYSVIAAVVDTVEALKIGKYAELEMIKQPYNVFDFKRHLKPPMSLNKVVTRSPDGRPKEANYFIDEELLCRVQFVFRNQIDSIMMHRRAEVLNYVKQDGTWTPDILIKKKTYDKTNPNDLFSIIEERESARAYLIKYITGAATGALLVNNPTWDTDHVAVVVAPFLEYCKDMTYNFIKIGTEDFCHYIEALDVTQEYTWLKTEIQGGVTLQKFMVDTLTYTTQDTFPEREINW